MVPTNQLERCFWKKNDRGRLKQDKKIDWNTSLNKRLYIRQKLDVNMQKQNKKYFYGTKNVKTFF